MKIIDLQNDAVAYFILLNELKCFYILLLLLDIQYKREDKSNLSNNLIKMENLKL